MSTLALPVGQGQERLTLWNRNFQLLWDSALAVAFDCPSCAPGPAYECIDDWVHAAIDYPNGTRWVGILYRCPEGIKRSQRPDPRQFMWPQLDGSGVQHGLLGVLR